MCGRFVLFAPPHKLKDLFGLENMLNIPARYNAAPLQELPIIIRNRIGVARWGLVPEWAPGDDKAMAAKMINARSETVPEKPSFRDLWAKGRRCLIPANGFYEWHKGEDGVNQPYFIHNPNMPEMAFAGLWAKNKDLLTFTILTKDADGDIKNLHHRMPVIFAPYQAQAWFSADVVQAQAMIAQATSQGLTYYKVSPAVGKVANDGEELILHRAGAETLFK